MSPLEAELRERTNVDTLVGTKIDDIEQGKELLAQVDRWSKELISEMAGSELNNEQTKAYSDVRYDLKTAKQRIGSQLTKLVKMKIANYK